MPFAIPGWMPWWLPGLLLVPLALLLLAFLCMPFSVFGLKGRLEGLEARLDEIQGEIRMLALRLPEPGPAEPERPPAAATRGGAMPRFGLAEQPAARQAAARPPIPPAPAEPDSRPRIVRPAAAPPSAAPPPMDIPVPPARSPAGPGPTEAARSNRMPTRGRSEPRLDWP